MSRGYDKLNLNHELLLGLTFEEMTGTITHDRAKPAHPCTLNGVPTWNSLGNGLPYLDFVSATPDWLACPQADTTDLEFDNPGDDFSMAAWVNFDNIAADMSIVCRGLLATDGWEWKFTTIGSDLHFYTYQLASSQSSNCFAPIVAGAWYLIGVSRHLTSIHLFQQGIDRTVGAVHTDPATANRELHIGVDDAHANGFDGQMWYPRIWGRQLAEWEFLELFNLERHWFGV